MTTPNLLTPNKTIKENSKSKSKIVEIDNLIDNLEKLSKQMNELNRRKVKILSKNESEELIKEFYLHMGKIKELYSFKIPENFFKDENNFPKIDDDDLELVLKELCKNEKVVEEAFFHLFDTTYILISLLYLSIITHGHSNVSRYPIKDFNPLEDYNENSIIIINFKHFIVILEEH